MIFHYIPPSIPPVPILLSIPHCGTQIPHEIPILGHTCPDTDWFLQHLYDFAPSLGIGVIHAKYARYVVDLNRNPASIPLYTDGRLITDAIPLQRFDGVDLYKTPPTHEERESRLNQYFHPYHRRIQELLEAYRRIFGWALLFDAHSIKRHVPTIQENPFPDLMLGSNDGQSAGAPIIQSAWSFLSSSSYRVQHNAPFKGGYITRSFGRPQENIHALQLEMSQDLYLEDESKPVWDPHKAKDIKEFLMHFLHYLTTIRP